MSLITPMLVQIALTFLVMFTLVRFRIVEIFSKRVNEDDIPLRKVEWPEKATRADSNFLSQFEMPVLFIALVILQVVTKTDDQLQLYLAWGYVISRILHYIFHIFISQNVIRTVFFTISSFILMAMWVRFAIAFYA
ncbi:MAG: MAPEG family protein [Rhodomicrobiaceae bacterium]